MVAATVYIAFCGVIAVMKFRMLTLTDKNRGKKCEATVTNVSKMYVIFPFANFNNVFSKRHLICFIDLSQHLYLSVCRKDDFQIIKFKGDIEIHQSLGKNLLALYH